MKPITGFVALLDVLGFKQIVSGPASERSLSAYLKAVGEGMAGKENSARIQFVLFSDSIVITTADDTHTSLLVLLRACSRLLGVLLQNEIPVRGAISCGDFFRESHDKGVFVAGRPIVEAYEFEQSQDWIGIMVTGSVLQSVVKLPSLCAMRKGKKESDQELLQRLPWTVLVQRCQSIPFHEDTVDGFAVLPTPSGNNVAENTKYLKTCIGKLERLKLLAPDPRAQRKYSAASTWMSEVRQTWGTFSGATDFPQRIPYPLPGL